MVHSDNKMQVRGPLLQIAAVLLSRILLTRAVDTGGINDGGGSAYGNWETILTWEMSMTWHGKKYVCFEGFSLTRDKDKVVKTYDYYVAHWDTWEIRIISTLPLFSLDLLRFYSTHEFQLQLFPWQIFKSVFEQKF